MVSLDGKIILIGDTGVGKSCIMHRFAGHPFVEEHVQTIGIDFIKRVLEMEGKKIVLKIWDTAGH